MPGQPRDTHNTHYSRPLRILAVSGCKLHSLLPPPRSIQGDTNWPHHSSRLPGKMTNADTLIRILCQTFLTADNQFHVCTSSSLDTNKLRNGNICSLAKYFLDGQKWIIKVWSEFSGGGKCEIAALVQQNISQTDSVFMKHQNIQERKVQSKTFIFIFSSE